MCFGVAVLTMVLEAWWIGARPWSSLALSADDAVEVGPVGGPIALTQTFKVEYAGLRAVALTLSPAAAPDGEPSVVLELGEVSEQGGSVPLYRMVRRLSEVASGRRVWWRFAPIANSAGRTYQVRVTVPNVLRERGVLVGATRDESYRSGILALDGREIWGDALMLVDAEQAVLAARIRAELFDARSSSAVWILLGIVVASLSLWVYCTLTRATTVEAPEHDPSIDSRVPRRIVAAALIVVAVYAASAGLRQRDRGGREPGARQLLDHMHAATLRTSMPHLQEAFAREPVTVSGREWECLVAVPSSRVTWREHIDAPGRLLLSYGMRPDVWHGPGDGAVFRIGLAAAGNYRDIKREWLSPADRTQDRGLRGLDLDLSPFVGSEIEVVLNTEPGPAGNAVGDAALWCAPRIAPRE